MNQAPKNPMLPYFVGYMGSSIQASSQVNGVHAVQKLAQQIGHELQNPSQIPEKATLAKFTILARLIRTMDAHQLEQCSRELYAPASKSASQSQSASEKVASWKAFRDAVAQAGTGPALMLIKEWIQNHKIQGEEAAEIVAALPTAARVPTKQYMDAFFDLIKKSEVQKQQFLNVSAVLSFTNLVRKAQVDNATAHNRYPTHVFGRLNPKKASAVARDYIPYLAQQLKDAVQNEDSHKTQVYIRALGNTAHPKILSVFEPYLEGKKGITEFQRLHIVVALNKLAKVYPKIARPVLFRLYQNTGEAQQIRSIAVYALMKTNPPASMLQRMAEFTNQDPSIQVRSIVKSAIESAANKLNGNQQQELSENAEAAAYMLNATEFGAQYSKAQFWSEDNNADMNMAYQAAMATIGSEDSNIPQAAFFNTITNLGGYRYKYISAGAMASSVDDLLQLFANQWQSQQSGKHHGKRSSSNSNSEWSTEKIANLLNIQPDEAAQVEANLLVNLLGQQRFFAIDNHTVEMLPQLMQKAARNLQSGENFNYTKLYNKMSVTMGFPTAMGLPFVFSLKNPSLLSIGGETRVRTQPDIANGPKDAIRMPNAVNASADVHFVFSSKLQSKIGFITPFDHYNYVAGLDKDLQLNLPIRANIDLDLQNAEVRVKLQPIESNKKAQIALIASRPYTAQQNILDLSPVDQRPIQVRKLQQANFTVGQDMTGMAFRVDAACENQYHDFAEIYNQIKNRDVMSVLLLPTAEETIKAYEVAVSYEPEKSTAKSVTLTASYDNNQDDDNNNSGEQYGSAEWKKSKAAKKAKRSNNDSSSSASDSDSNESISDFSSEQKSASQNAANPSSTAPNSQSRQQQLLRRAAAGIKSANAAVLDLSAQFNGQTKAHFIATAAVANSPVDDKSRVLVYLRRDPARAKEQQLALAATSKMPNVPVINYLKAIKADPNSAFQCQINFGEKLDSSASQININGQMKQTSARRELVQRMPIAQLCQQQMEHGNYALPACQNATVEANRMDLFKVNVRFEKVSDFVKNATYKAYDAARYLGWQYNSENFINPKNAHNNKIDLELRFAPNMRHANLSVEAPAISAEFNNVRMHPYVTIPAALHPMYTPWEMLAEKVMQNQYNPTCTVDKNAANTFDNKTYPLNLGNDWHAMMVSVPKDNADSSSSSQEDATDLVAVLVRDASSHDQKEIKIVLGDDLVEMTPSGSSNGANVKVNGRTIHISSRNVTEVQNQNGDLLAQFYALPDAVKMVAPEHEIEILYDGTRVVLTASQSFQGEVRGLCGTFTGEETTDFTTPANCILREPKQFAATWAINPTGAVREQQQKAQQAKCYNQVTLIGDSISDAEAGRYQAKSRSSSKSSKHSSKKHSSNGKRASGKSSSHSSSSGSRLQTPGDCTAHRVQVVKQNNQICFSLKPQPTCNSRCQPVQQYEKAVQFHCIADSTASRHWAEMVNKGANPDFSQKGANKSIKMSIPESCRP